MTSGSQSISGTTTAKSSTRVFQQHIHLFRAVAICLIIATHSVPSFDWSDRPAVQHAFSLIFEQTSALFFFISGYLFQHLSYRFQYKDYLNRKFRTIILPYIIVSFPALIISLFFVKQEGIWPWFYDLPVAAQAILFYLTGKHLEPLWFVPTVALYYIASPLFIRIDRTPRLYWLIIPFLILSIALGRDGPLGPINKAPFFLPIYLFGMWFSHFRDRAEAITRRFLWLILAGIALVMAAIWAGPDGIDLQILFKLLLCPVILICLQHFSDRPSVAAGYVADISFGIYFVHAYFIAAFRLLYTVFGGRTWGGSDTTALFPPSIVGFLLHSVVVLAASVTIIWLVQRLFPKHSRQLVGA